MSVCLTVCYAAVDAPSAFVEAYVGEHAPLGNEILAEAGLSRWTFGRTVAGDAESPQFIANLYFEASLDEVQRVLASESGQRLLQDAVRIAGPGFDSYVSETRELCPATAEPAP